MAYGDTFLKKKPKPKEREIAIDEAHVNTAVEQYLWSQRLINADEKVTYVGVSELSGKRYITLKEDKT